MALPHKKWWSLSRNESYGLITIVVLIIVGAAVLYVIRSTPAKPLPKEQCDKARAFITALDTVSIDYEKTSSSHKRKRGNTEKGGRKKGKAKAKSSGTHPSPRGGGSDLKPMDRIEN